MRTDTYYENNDLHITQSNWDALKKNKGGVAFSGVVAAAKETIQKGGAFIVYCDITDDIQHKCDRPSELDAILP